VFEKEMVKKLMRPREGIIVKIWSKCIKKSFIIRTLNSIQVGKHIKDEVRRTSKIMGKVKRYAYLFGGTTLWAIII
jgi:hypothetical protein